MWIFLLFVALLSAALICACRKRIPTCRWLILVTLILYCLYYGKGWLAVYFPAVAEFIVSSVLFTVGVLFILLAAALICAVRKKYSACKWLIFVALIFYLATNLNTLSALYLNFIN